MNLLAEHVPRRQIALLALYGLSYIMSPLYGTSEAVLFPSLAEYGDAILLSRILNLFGFAIAMALCAIAGEKLKGVVFSRATSIILAAIGVVGMIAPVMVGSGVLPIPWLWAGALARGLFFGAFTMCWVDVLMHLDDSLVGITVSAALAVYGLGGLAILGASLVSPAVVAIGLVLCPLLSVFGFATAASRENVQQPIAQESAVAPFRTRCLLYLANFAFGIVLGTPLSYFARFSDPPAIIAFAAMAVALLAVFAFAAGKVSADMVFRGIMLAYVFAITAFLLFGLLDSAVGIIAISSLATVVLYSVIIFADTQARLRKPYWKVPGMCQVFAAAGMTIAWVACYALYPDGAMPEIQVMLCMCLSMIFITSIFAPNSRSRVRPWGFSSLIPAETAEEYTLRRCSELADEFALTSREHEILMLLAMGRTRDDIAETFVISPATVKTHIRNIYSKLGIHSQAELVDLIKDA